jgi:hypothetical protein
MTLVGQLYSGSRAVRGVCGDLACSHSVVKVGLAWMLTKCTGADPTVVKRCGVYAGAVCTLGPTATKLMSPTQRHGSDYQHEGFRTRMAVQGRSDAVLFVTIE